MTFRPGRLIPAYVITQAILCGCGQINQEEAFVHVVQTVRDRSQTDPVWVQGETAAREINQRVALLLSQELTDRSAVEVALLRNRRLQAVYEELSVAQSDLVSAGLLRNPVLDAEIRYPEGGGRASLEMAVVQNFLDILYIPLRKQMAGAAFDAAKLRVSAAVIDLIGETRRGFYSYQACEQLLEMRHTVLKAAAASYDLAKRMHRAGNMTDLELANERVLFEQAKLDTASAELAADQARERLTSLMGLWGVETRWTVGTRLPEPPLDQPENSKIEQVTIGRSLDLETARLTILKSGFEFDTAKPLALFGDAGLGLSAEGEPEREEPRENRKGERRRGRESVEWMVGPAVSLPIPIFNQGQPALVKAHARLRQAEESYAALAVAIRSEARSVANRVQHLHAQSLYYLQVVLPLQQQVLGETQRQYNAMQIGAFELLQAKKRQIETGAEYIRTLRDYWLARVDQDQLVAGGRVRLEGREPGNALVHVREEAFTTEPGGSDK